MASLSTISIQRPVLAIVMSLVIVLFGVISFTFLGVREYPSIDPPVITVRTSYTGANADVIQSQITEPLEKSLNGIEGIRTISSSSNQGSSVVTVEFNLGANLEAAANDVRDKVSQAVRQLPQDIDALPVVTKADANSDAILMITLQSNTKNQLQVSDYAENVIAERLQTIPGVSTVQIMGQKKYAMRIWMDPSKMASYGITASDIVSALDKENVELPGGKIEGNNTELSVKTVGKLPDEAAFNNLIIKTDGDRIVRLINIGYARLGPENEETILKESGIPMIGLGIVPQPGANYLEIAEEFYKRIKTIKKDLPKDYSLQLAMDNTKFIKLSIEEVEETLAISIILVIVIIYLFFRDWLIAFRPLIDIPVSLIGAFFIMYLMGYSINVLTLLAIVLATGLVVDDGIVVTENIYKKIEQGKSPIDAAIEGSNEIFFAVVATSITLAAVFMPVIFLEGFVGRLFREFGVVIAGAVIISAFVSLTLTPMLNAKLVKKDPNKKSKFYVMTEPFFVSMIKGYENALSGFLKIRWVALVIIFCSFVVIVLLWKSLQSELAPLDDRSGMRLTVTAPEGASFEYTDHFMDKLSTFIQDSVPEKSINITITAPGFSGSGAVNTGAGRILLSDPKDRERSQMDIANYINKITKQFPEAKTFTVQQQTISTGGRSGLPIQFVLQAPNFEKLKEKLPLFLEEVNKNPTFQTVDVDLKFNKPELYISIDRDKTKSLGVSVIDIAQALQLSLSGQRFGYFNMNGKQYQIVGQVDRANRDEPLDLRSMYVRSSTGQLIQIDNLVHVEEQSSPPQLFHYNRYQAATVSAGLAPGKTIGDGIDAMNQISKKVLDESFSTALAGASRDYSESSSNIMFAFILALLLIFLVLSAQFESFIDPLIIMFTVPLAVVGALFSLWYFNQTINIFSQIGMIMLVGLVTKNGILIVEFANHLKEQGKSVGEAILEASAARLRPILMTSMATALGALPIALALGAGSKSRMSMGIVVVGGLLLSLALTLFVIPAMYTFLSRVKKTKISLNKTVAVVIFLSLSLGVNSLQAQDTLKLDDAISMGLESNFSVVLAKNNLEIAQANNTWEYMLPSFGVNAGYTNNLTNSYQRTFADSVRQGSNLVSSGLTASALVNWKIFDGFNMFVAKDKLEEFERIGESQTRFAMEDIISRIVVGYYNILLQEKMLSQMKEALQISIERKRIIASNYSVGSASQLTLMQAQADLNADSSALIRQQVTYKNAQADLNRLTGKETSFNFFASGNVSIDNSLQYEELNNRVKSQNTELLISKYNERVSVMNIDQARSGRYPQLSLFGGYNYARNTFAIGFAQLSRSYGPTYGATLTWNLYGGGATKRNVQNAKIQKKTSEYERKDLELQLSSDLYKIYNEYQMNISLVGIEKENMQITERNVFVALEKYKLGSFTDLQLRDVQSSFLDASSRLYTSIYQAKQSETELLRMSGQLIK